MFENLQASDSRTSFFAGEHMEPLTGGRYCRSVRGGPYTLPEPKGCRGTCRGAGNTASSAFPQASARLARISPLPCARLLFHTCNMDASNKSKRSVHRTPPACPQRRHGRICCNTTRGSERPPGLHETCERDDIRTLSQRRVQTNVGS